MSRYLRRELKRLGEAVAKQSEIDRAATAKRHETAEKRCLAYRRGRTMACAACDLFWDVQDVPGPTCPRSGLSEADLR